MYEITVQDSWIGRLWLVRSTTSGTIVASGFSKDEVRRFLSDKLAAVQAEAYLLTGLLEDLDAR